MKRCGLRVNRGLKSNRDSSITPSSWGEEGGKRIKWIKWIMWIHLPPLTLPLSPSLHLILDAHFLFKRGVLKWNRLVLYTPHHTCVHSALPHTWIFSRGSRQARAQVEVERSSSLLVCHVSLMRTVSWCVTSSSTALHTPSLLHHSLREQQPWNPRLGGHFGRMAELNTLTGLKWNRWVLNSIGVSQMK